MILTVLHKAYLLWSWFCIVCKQFLLWSIICNSPVIALHIKWGWTQVMLTTRNIFIATLAVSDILLCSFSMPLTLVDILTNYWTLGQNMASWKSSLKHPESYVLLLQEILCKLIGAIQSTCVFFSSFSILLIACDRYFFIVHPTRSQITIKQVTLQCKGYLGQKE